MSDEQDDANARSESVGPYCCDIRDQTVEAWLAKRTPAFRAAVDAARRDEIWPHDRGEEPPLDNAIERVRQVTKNLDQTRLALVFLNDPTNFDRLRVATAYMAAGRRLKMMEWLIEAAASSGAYVFNSGESEVDDETLHWAVDVVFRPGFMAESEPGSLGLTDNPEDDLTIVPKAASTVTQSVSRLGAYGLLGEMFSGQRLHRVSEAIEAAHADAAERSSA